MDTLGLNGLARALVLLGILAWSTAHAQVAVPPPDAARPWATGVSQVDQAIALELRDAGNREFAESRFAQALAKYKEAIQHWDHPAIRFNMAVCLINLDQPVEARADVERSLTYGVTPLGADAYSQGMTYLKLLDAQLARLRIACQEPGAEVTLDGKLLFTAPGVAEQYLIPGEHQVVATKPGYLTASETLVGVAGKLTARDIALTLEGEARVVRRWRPWMPWTVLATGTALVAGGALSFVASNRDFVAFDSGVKSKCPTGCDAEQLRMLGLGALRDRARGEQVLAAWLVSLGGAAVITGVAGVLLNSPRVENRLTPIVAPTPGGATVSVGWGF